MTAGRSRVAPVDQAVDFEGGGVGGECAVAGALGEVDPGWVVQPEDALGVGGQFVDAAGDPGRVSGSVIASQASRATERIPPG